MNIIEINSISFNLRKLKRLKIGIIYLFGSYAEGSFGFESDIDIAKLLEEKGIVGKTFATKNLTQMTQLGTRELTCRTTKYLRFSLIS